MVLEIIQRFRILALFRNLAFLKCFNISCFVNDCYLTLSSDVLLMFEIASI